MLLTKCIIIHSKEGKREILVSPFLLQSKELPDIKSGKLNKLFFYENWIDDEYKANLNQEYLDERFKTDRYLINFGQDFGRYYLGCLSIDVDTKRYWDWQGGYGKFDDNEVKILGESLFDLDAESRKITVFTPTWPSDFRFSIS
jgi:hypothetical protein